MEFPTDNDHDGNNIMDVQVLATITALVCCVLGLWWLIICRRNRNAWPPGPRGLPIIGNLHQLGDLPHQSLARLSLIHGPLMSLRLGSIPLLVVSSPHTAKLILHTHDKSFAGRALHVSAPVRIFGPSCRNILFHQPDPYWKFMRQICVTEFFSKKRFDHFHDVRNGEVRALLRSLLPLQGQPLTVRDHLHTATTNIISHMVLGQEFVPADISALSFTSVLLDVKNSLGMFEIGDYIPWLAWLDLQGYQKRDRDVACNVHTVMQKIIDTRRQESQGASSRSPPRNFLDVLLAASDDQAKNKDLPIEDADVRDVLIDMLLAGTDTTVVPVEWGLAELLSNPEKLRKVQKELEEVVGRSRTVEESDLQNLPYLRAVVNETMRLHVPGPLLVPHMSVEPCELEGYKIPPHTVVYVNAWAVQRDPQAWTSPMEFRPERFLDCPVQLDNVPGQHFELIPFGAGRRSCPAYRLGSLLLQILMANLVHAFNWSLPEPGKLSMKERFGIAVTMEEPLVAVPSPRLPSHAFA